ncbi:autotransporter outer membrane beta-barrel domain-containing protein [Polynucleobacter sp. MWH-Spelu-300-X4]|uniref:autotransporter outer membrane beta-barrel domain-containing protein n=1 Tax=Polynucleobacter sp. MWH-Spelu-300-X4 TaxID=2689109 RepID=UPI001BFE39FB|nr:autotransporter outer membrane beta-barrel domain-containing protein [Polynucleobacter sp. MWH-Spelu-300-X4]QWD79580.1 autotransporter outer membrane beta-barrel domain-containing protein [Polynucleobacter sp. MWH-Spelu-300-X4]
MKFKLSAIPFFTSLCFAGNVFAIDTTISTNTTNTYSLSASENLMIDANLSASGPSNWMYWRNNYGLEVLGVAGGNVTINTSKYVEGPWAGIRLTGYTSDTSIDTLTNGGFIGASQYLGQTGTGIWLYGNGTLTDSITRINTLINTGSIQVNNGQGSTNAAIQLDLFSSIGTIENRSGGIIDGTGGPAAIWMSGGNSSVTTITNYGTISGGSNYAIYNQNGSIGELNNLQGSGSPLTYKGILPTNYNIIVNSPTQFGRLAGYSVTGQTTFGIYSGSTLAVGTYSSVLTGISASNLTGPYTNQIFGAYKWSLVNTSGTTWELDVMLAGPTAADTQSSLELSANALKSIYALQTSTLTAGLSYDCSIFDKNGICVSVGGRYNRVNTGETKAANGLVIGAYKVHPNVRLGAWVDQNLSVNTGTGVNLSNSKPMFGVFGVWNADKSGNGLELKVAAGYGDKDLTVTRETVGSSGEAGTGKTRLNTQGVSAVVSYNAPVIVNWVASPYLGARYTKVRAGGYTESDAVTTPLTYSELKQEAATALAGINLSGRLMSNFGVLAGLGAELDTTNRGNNYSATGVTGLTDIAFNPNIKRLRGSANVGAYLDIDKTQRVSLNAVYREEAFQRTNTLSTMATYTAGF